MDLLEIQSHGQKFALPLVDLLGVAELASLAPIPRAPRSVRGLVTFRGELLLGVELSALVGQSDTGITDLRRVIALTSHPMKIAILGEKILSIRTAPRDSFKPEPSRHGFVVGIDENFISLVAPDLLAAHVLQLLRHDRD